jgi:tetratricopeptide (TPR) repeat protein
LRTLLVLATMLTTGCSAGGGTLRAGSVETTAPVTAAPAGDASAGAVEPAQEDAGGSLVPPARPRNAGAVSLQAQAASERSAGEYERSAATLERAIRIAPDDASLWLDLGGVRLAQGRPDLAEGMARRAAALAGGDARLRREAEALAERARRSR